MGLFLRNEYRNDAEWYCQWRGSLSGSQFGTGQIDRARRPGKPVYVGGVAKPAGRESDGARQLLLLTDRLQLWFSAVAIGLPDWKMG